MRPSVVVGLLVAGLFVLAVGGVVRFASHAEPEPEPKPSGSSRNGQGAGYWLVKAIDATVGLPEPERPYDDHAEVARQVMDAIDAGEAPATYQAAWTDAVGRVGPPDALKGERRWSSMRPGESGTYTFRYSRNHANGSTITDVGVVRRESALVVVSFEVKPRHFRMRDR